MTSSSSGDLQRLRDALDVVDRKLLQFAAERQSIVGRIAAAKTRDAVSTADTADTATATDADNADSDDPTGPSVSSSHPLFDRERAVYTRGEAIAAEVGLPISVARGLLAVLIEHSHETQTKLTTADAMTRESPQRMLVVGGDGRMGQRLGSAFAERGHEVNVLERDDDRPRADVVANADVVMISVPMDIVNTVIDDVGPLLRDDALICDINSLKEGPCARMAALSHGEAVGLHPMFGPTVHVLRRQKVVVCPVREGPRSAWLRRELTRMGMELIESDPVTHDRMMAVVQVLTHFSTLVMGEALRSTGIALRESLSYTSPIYRLELAFVGRLFAQSPELYAEIEMTNPHAVAARRSFLEAAARLDDIIGRGDRETFYALFDGVARYFEAFGDEAMALSDHIIDSIVARP